jgi:hypothetical protein
LATGIGTGGPAGGEMRASTWPVASVDSDFDPYLTGHPASTAALFWRFLVTSSTDLDGTF